MNERLYKQRIQISHVTREFLEESHALLGIQVK